MKLLTNNRKARMISINTNKECGIGKAGISWSRIL